MDMENNSTKFQIEKAFYKKDIDGLLFFRYFELDNLSENQLNFNEYIYI